VEGHIVETNQHLVGTERAVRLRELHDQLTIILYRFHGNEILQLLHLHLMMMMMMMMYVIIIIAHHVM
jgi:hypothetical protein